ncbi:MAG: Crp/Fnr family transcriptional regulator [Tissierellia bacterium]|nr:Crp/Fnr family transcriptional regulator [Tissierellia bacterium]
MIDGTDDLHHYSPWIRFKDIKWDEPNLASYLRSFKPNEIIYHQQQYDDYVYLVKEGRIRICIYSVEGNEQCLTIAEEGSVFGELSAIDGLPNFGTAISLTNSNVYVVPKPFFLELIFFNDGMTMKILQSLVKKVRVLSSNIQNLTFKDSYSRVITYLVKLAHSHGSFDGSRCELNMKFTHQEMANLTGLNRVTVSNIMSSLTTMGLISKADGYMVIEDINKLNDLK